MSRVVLVTGVSRHLGSRMAKLLSQDPQIDRVVGVDIDPQALVATPETAMQGLLSGLAIAFDTTYDFYEAVKQSQVDGPVHCVLIDESQFLTPLQVLQLTRVCDQLSVPVLCYGIRTDFQGEPFEGSKYLLAWADNIIEIKTICRSGKKATMNARLDEHGNQVTEGAQIDIGHHYEALSRKEFRLEEVSPVAHRPAT